MDFSKLSNGDKVVAGSGIALFIFSFLPWYKGETKGGFGLGAYSVGTNSGWNYFFTGIVPVLLALLLVAYVVVTKLVDGVKLPELPVPYPLVVLGAAALAALLVLLRLIIGSGEDIPAIAKDYFDITRAYGLYLSTLAVLGLAGGAFLKFQEDGGEFPTKGGGTTGGSGTQGSGGSPTPF